ncbi:MAG: 2OG-Fe(II) oxygenase [Phenylobacterium sp.]|nr:MAG: 2OG-Fe(II) oxygenase [Phenylobacterium sp.]
MAGMTSSRRRPGGSPPLDDLKLGCQTWAARSDPFPHFVAHNVFSAERALAIENAFREVLDRGLSFDVEPERFSRNLGEFDAFGVNFSATLPLALHLFFSRRWCEHLIDRTGIRDVVHAVNGGLHFHCPGSSSGRIHNDFNPGWFSRTPNHGDGWLSDEEVCSYRSGQIVGSGAPPLRLARAIAMIYYLNNPPWPEGDGGFTGLYRSPLQALLEPSRIVPPVNNSMLIFECSPKSFHSFVGDNRFARSSVIMWLHRDVNISRRCWGQADLVEW